MNYSCKKSTFKLINTVSFLSFLTFVFKIMHLSVQEADTGSPSGLPVSVFCYLYPIIERTRRTCSALLEIFQRHCVNHRLLSCFRKVSPVCCILTLYSCVDILTHLFNLLGPLNVIAFVFLQMEQGYCSITRSDDFAALSNRILYFSAGHTAKVFRDFIKSAGFRIC